MDQEKKEKIALFRFGIIGCLIAVKVTEKGERERRIREISHAEWDIPFTGRSYVSRTTVLDWLKRYEKSGRRLESLYPKDRRDRGKARSMDEESQQAFIKLKYEFPKASLRALLKIAHQRKVLPGNFHASLPSMYRLFQRHGLEPSERTENFQAFEAELPNDLWQSDAMHGPWVLEKGKLRKTYLFAFIDDHSRLIPHAEFYLRENLENYTRCVQKALAKRGLPRKLYVDNGPSFRSHQLAHACASLGIALIHAKPYRPQGKGKIERWFQTVQKSWMPTLPKNLSLDQLNEKLQEWIDGEYHITSHSTTGQKPLERFLKALHLLRAAPKDLTLAFRSKLHRKVRKERIVAICGRLFEAPLGLVGKTIILRAHSSEPDKVEAFYQDRSYGFLTPLDRHVNYRKRSRDPEPDKALAEKPPSVSPQSGKLFGPDNNKEQ